MTNKKNKKIISSIILITILTNATSDGCPFVSKKETTPQQLGRTDTMYSETIDNALIKSSKKYNDFVQQISSANKNNNDNSNKENISQKKRLTLFNLTNTITDQLCNLYPEKLAEFFKKKIVGDKEQGCNIETIIEFAILEQEIYLQSVKEEDNNIDDENNNEIPKKDTDNENTETLLQGIKNINKLLVLHLLRVIIDKKNLNILCDGIKSYFDTILNRIDYIEQVQIAMVLSYFYNVNFVELSVNEISKLITYSKIKDEVNKSIAVAKEKNELIAAFKIDKNSNIKGHVFPFLKDFVFTNFVLLIEDCARLLKEKFGYLIFKGENNKTLYKHQPNLSFLSNSDKDDTLEVLYDKNGKSIYQELYKMTIKQINSEISFLGELPNFRDVFDKIEDKDEAIYKIKTIEKETIESYGKLTEHISTLKNDKENKYAEKLELLLKLDVYQNSGNEGQLSLKRINKKTFSEYLNDNNDENQEFNDNLYIKVVKKKGGHAFFNYVVDVDTFTELQYNIIKELTNSKDDETVSENEKNEKEE